MPFVTATDTSSATASDTFHLAVIGVGIVTDPISGIATISDVGGASNDQVGAALSADGLSLVLTSEGVTTTIPLAGLTNLVFNGGGGNDTLTVDLRNGPLPFDITFNGGSEGNDALIVSGFDDSDLFTAYTANYSNRFDGTIQFRNGNAILTTLTYTGLEPITIDGTPTEIIFNLPNTDDPDVTLLDIGGTDNVMQLTGSTFETTDFSIAAATSITINANAGNDRITIQSIDANFAGVVIINGGAGNDVIIASSSTVSTILRGDAGNDTLTGSDFSDTLSGGLGSDLLNGGGGIDTVAEGDASKLTLKNTLLTGRGNDTLTSIERAVLTGNASNNLLDASAFTLGSVTLFGGDGNDTLLGGSSDDSFDGGDGVDIVRQHSTGNQTIAGDTLIATLTGVGTDMLASVEAAQLIGLGRLGLELEASGFSGAVTLVGTSGNDTLTGGSGGNALIGNTGHDSVSGGSGTDTMDGGAGRDTLVGNGGNDLVRGGSGNDLLDGGVGDDRLFGDGGGDKLLGGDGNDYLNGGSGNDTLTGDAGDDIILGGNGSDAIRGGAGNDIISGDAGNDTLLGGTGDDTLRSGSGSDRLDGGRGNDFFEAFGSRITFGGGDDTIAGSGNRIDALFVFDFEKLLV